MKVGDKLLCKKSYPVQDDSWNFGINAWIISNKCYVVSGCDKNTIVILDEYGDELRFFFKDDLSEFFYTEQEMRKQKLEKLNAL